MQLQVNRRAPRGLASCTVLIASLAGCVSYPAAYNRFAPPEDHPSLIQRADEVMQELELQVQRIDEWMTRTFY